MRLLLLLALTAPPLARAAISNRLDAGVNGAVTETSNVDIYCSVVSPDAGSMTSCQWTAPDGAVYTVDDGLVTNEQGNVMQNLLVAGRVLDR